jgi:glycosyltransferase involved in cell wall biosynthesis
MSRIGVMQGIDSLQPGGAERVAVNIANALPRDRYRSFLCATRQEGPLKALIRPDTTSFYLYRKGRLDLGAILRLSKYCRDHDIAILHAHSTSLFLAVLVGLLPPYPRVVWHVHYGRLATVSRRPTPYWLAARRLRHVFAVSDDLARWSVKRLGLSKETVEYLPNFVAEEKAVRPPTALPGCPGKRIVCVGNFRAVKDHLTLIRAVRLVKDRIPAVHLVHVGGAVETGVREAVVAEIERLGLGDAVSLLGERSDVASILQACDVGVLSSVSEGLPLSLIEYGFAGLASVCTKVGQCAEVLDFGNSGILVPPSDPEALAGAVFSLLTNDQRKVEFARRFKERVAERYSQPRAVARLSAAYEECVRDMAPEGRRDSDCLP